MEKYKILLESVNASDLKAIKDTQTKLNQWITIGKLVKYEVLTAGNFIIFNICLKKDTTL